MVDGDFARGFRRPGKGIGCTLPDSCVHRAGAAQFPGVRYQWYRWRSGWVPGTSGTEVLVGVPGWLRLGCGGAVGAAFDAVPTVTFGTCGN